MRGGDLWMVDIKWTADGERRLREKTQRYLSPTFHVDATGRVVELLNVALTALPSLHDAPELMKASRRLEASMAEESLAPEEVLTVQVDRIGAITAALGLEPGASVEEVRAAFDAVMVSLDAVEQIIDAESSGDAADPLVDALPGDEEVLSESADGMSETDRVAARRICRLAGRSTLTAALATVAQWRKAEVNQQQFRVEQLKLEAAERCRLVVSLIKLGADTPATAWKRNADGTPNVSRPVDRLMREPIAQLRARVAALSKQKQSVAVKPPPLGVAAALSRRALAACQRLGVDPNKYVALRNAIESRSATGHGSGR
jgi:phage I-like protein